MKLRRRDESKGCWECLRVWARMLERAERRVACKVWVRNLCCCWGYG